MTAKSSPQWSMPSSPCANAADALEGDPTNCMPTKVTTSSVVETICEPGPSRPVSQDAASIAANTWESIDGLSSEPSLGSTSSVASPSATSAMPTSTKPSSSSLPQSSASEPAKHGFVRRSKPRSPMSAQPRPIRSAHLLDLERVGWRPATRDWPESYAILTTTANVAPSRSPDRGAPPRSADGLACPPCRRAACSDPCRPAPSRSHACE